MRIDPNYSGRKGACVYIDMWDEMLDGNPLCWDILYKMEEIILGNEIFRQNDIKGPRMYEFPHEIYNSNPNIVDCMERAFSRAYETVMARTVPATKDREICDLKNKNKRLEASLKNREAEIKKLREKLCETEEEVA